MERRAVSEKERLRAETLDRLRQTKEAILASTIESLGDTTKRTLAENEMMTSELAFQSQQAELLV